VVNAPIFSGLKLEPGGFRVLREGGVGSGVVQCVGVATAKTDG